MPEEQFRAILKEFEIDPKVFDPEVKTIFENCLNHDSLDDRDEQDS